MTLIWTRQALADLQAAHDYIAEENPFAAVSVIERIKKSLSVLKHHPHIGRTGRVESTRELIIPGTPFLIPYRLKTQTIELLAVLHAARRWPDSF